MSNLKSFIDSCKPHEWGNGHPPTTSEKRHEWESKILYSVIDSLSDKNCILDYGCGRNGTLRFSLYNRFPQMKYIGLDPDKPQNRWKSECDEQNYVIGDFSLLNAAIEEADCIVTGSIFTHIDWETIEAVLDSFKIFFNRGGEFGFTVFLGDKYNTFGKSNWYKRSSTKTYHVVATTVKQYEDYCRNNNLQFNLLPYDYRIRDRQLHGLTHQYFCNIRK